MQLRELSVTNFKNIADARLELSPGVNCFLGDNGMGKSNLLDAIYCLSFTRSFTGAPDPMLMRTGEAFAMLRGLYTRRGLDEELTLGLARGRRKSVKRDGKEYRRIAEHIGLFPLVMVSPQDIDLIRGPAEERRRWIDMVISQGDARYLDALMRYNRALEQRNSMLREGCVDMGLYDAVELPMEAAAAYIHQCRRAKIAELQPMFRSYYSLISGSGEGDAASLALSSHLDDGRPLRALLDSARRHDEMVRHTSVGPHRDDIELRLHDLPLRRTGSQGQCKTFTLALRLAQHDFLASATGLTPMLLLDDIFDKLDASRVARIMELVTRPGRGQIFITDTHRRHLDEIVALTGAGHRLWSVASGVFTPLF